MLTPSRSARQPDFPGWVKNEWHSCTRLSFRARDASHWFFLSVAVQRELSGFGILLSLRSPKSPHSITSHSLLILGRTLIFLIHVLKALCKHCWAQPTLLLVALSPSRWHQTEPRACPGQGVGRARAEDLGEPTMGWGAAPDLLLGVGTPSQTPGFPWQLFWRLHNYNFISVIKHTRARFNFCPVTLGKLDPNDKAGLVLWCWVGACVQ